MFTCTGPCGGFGDVAQRADRPAKEIAAWRAHMAQRRATVKSFQSALGRVVMAARTETLRHIEERHGKFASELPATRSSLPATETAQRAASSHLLFDLTRFALDFFSATEKQQKAGLDTAGVQCLAELGLDDPFKHPPAEVLAFLQSRKNKLKNVPDEIYARLKKEIEAGLEDGDTTAQLAARAKQFFNGLDAGQLRTIALTETSAVYGQGRDFAMKQAGVQFKAWLTSGNANVRSSHEQAGLDYPQDRGIPLDEPFIVDGEALQYPGDDAGSAGNVINCHCVQIAVKAPAAE
jgi:hypothetical protein